MEGWEFIVIVVKKKKKVMQNIEPLQIVKEN